MEIQKRKMLLTWEKVRRREVGPLKSQEHLLNASSGPVMEVGTVCVISFEELGYIDWKWVFYTVADGNFGIYHSGWHQ